MILITKTNIQNISEKSRLGSYIKTIYNKDKIKDKGLSFYDIYYLKENYGTNGKDRIFSLKSPENLLVEQKSLDNVNTLYSFIEDEITNYYKDYSFYLVIGEDIYEITLPSLAENDIIEKKIYRLYFNRENNRKLLNKELLFSSLYLDDFVTEIEEYIYNKYFIYFFQS